MPSAASSTRATWAFAWRPASSRMSAAPRSAASRIRRTCSDVPADSDAAGRAAGGAALAQPLDLVRDAAQMLVDGCLLVPAAPDGEVAPLDVLSIHGGEDTSPIRLDLLQDGVPHEVRRARPRRSRV